MYINTYQIIDHFLFWYSKKLEEKCVCFVYCICGNVILVSGHSEW